MSNQDQDQEEEDRRTCYFPDGSIAKNNVPCTSAEFTSCCGDTDLCLTNGLCINTGHQPYLLSRGACTKKEWGYGCPNHCENIDKSRGVSMVNLKFNSDTPATYCCGTPITDSSSSSSSSSSSDSSPSIVCPNGNTSGFEVEDGQIIFGRAALSNITTAPNGTEVDTGTPAGTGTGSAPESSRTMGTCASAETCNETAVGAGVGVPLGLIAVAAIVWALWERRRAEKVAARAGAGGGGPVVWSEVEGDGSGKLGQARAGRMPVQELEDTRPVPEIMGRERERQGGGG